MADGRLRPAGRLDQIARADLVFGGGDERQQSKSDRVGEGGERLRQQLGLVFGEAVATNGRATCDRVEHGGAARGHPETVSKIFEEYIDDRRIIRQTHSLDQRSSI